MKLFLISFLTLSMLFVCAQEKTIPTNQFIVEGKVKKQIQFSFKDSKDYTATSLDSIVIYNHLLQRRKVIKDIKGILLRDVIDKAGLDETNPKLLSEFYFTCIAEDGYKVVFSWNEMFNTDIGNKIIVITEEDGKKGDDVQDRIAIVSALDKATGRRYVKGLQKVIVERVK